MKYLFYLLIMALLSGCGGSNTKEFLFSHSDISFQVNSSGKIYNKYTDVDDLNSLSCNGEILTFYIKEEPIELLISGKYQKIPKTNYEVKSG